MTITRDLMPVLFLRRIRTGIFLPSTIAILLILFLVAPGALHAGLAAGEIVGTADGKFFIRAEQASLLSIIAALHRDFDLGIKGLEALEREKITLAFEAVSLEELVKGLLRHLNLKNYAFEFEAEGLKRVVVFPAAKSSLAMPADNDADAIKREEAVTVAVIKSVVESSQAEALGLLQGDFILEYDGIRIDNAAQLVHEVKKRSAKNQIDILVVRDKSPLRFVLRGGFIGVRITTEKISKQSYPDFF
jgi:predicted metalloprotease with PDZ domain